MRPPGCPKWKDLRAGCGVGPGTGVRRKSNKPMENKFQALYFGCKTPGESVEKLFCKMFSAIISGKNAHLGAANKFTLMPVCVNFKRIIFRFQKKEFIYA